MPARARQQPFRETDDAGIADAEANFDALFSDLGRALLVSPATSPDDVVETSAGTDGAAAALPALPEGYVRVDIPGVGVRVIPYYSEP